MRVSARKRMDDIVTVETRPSEIKGASLVMVQRVLRGGEGQGLLESYGRERLASWRFLLGRQGGLRPGAGASPFAAKNAARLLPCFPATGGDLGALAGQLALKVDRG